MIIGFNYNKTVLKISFAKHSINTFQEKKKIREIFFKLPVLIKRSVLFLNKLRNLYDYFMQNKKTTVKSKKKNATVYRKLKL